MKLKSLLTLGVATIGVLPIVGVVSCSNKSSSSVSAEISKETNDEYYSVLWSDQANIDGTYTNKLSDSLEKATGTQSKTTSEVMEIAKNTLDRISDEMLRETLLNSMIKGVAKNIYINSEDEDENSNFASEDISFVDIQNFSFDRENMEISFDYVYSISLVNKMNDEIFLTMNQKMLARYKKIKIEANVFSWNNQLFPIIRFSQEQPNGSIQIMKIGASLDINNDGFNKVLHDFYEQNRDEILNNLQMDEQQFITFIKQSLNYQIESTNKWAKMIENFGDKIGKVNGKLTFNYQYTEYFDSNKLVVNPNNGYSDGDTSIPTIITAVTPTMESPIFFSKYSGDGTAYWQCFKPSNVAKESD